MAEEMRSVSRHVTATTGAVVAMQAAVILAEEKAARHVCDNVNRGFHALIRSQISQKMAKLQSEVDSHLMQLVQQKKALLAIKARMQRDYQMISSRYLKLFNSLNANLRQRVFELDKPTIDFALKEVSKVTNRSRLLTATVPVAQQETLIGSQRILASNVRYRGVSVIGSMQHFLSEMNTQNQLTDSILIRNGEKPVTAKSHIPVVICICNRNEHGNGVELTIPEHGLDQSAKNTVVNVAYASVAEIQWKQHEAVTPEVTASFNQMLSSSSHSDRVKETANRLFRSSVPQSL